MGANDTEVPDTRAKGVEPLYSLDELLGVKDEKKGVAVAEMPPPHDKKSTWLASKMATRNRIKKEKRRSDSSYGKRTFRLAKMPISKRDNGGPTNEVVMAAVGTMLGLMGLIWWNKK